MSAENNSRTTEIVRALENDILLGKRAPGERLDERSLAAHFGVSRTPAREALQRLASNGLATLRGRKGARVVQLSIPDLLDAFYVVAELEAMAAGQSARRITKQQRMRLEERHRACQTSAEASDPDGFYEDNLRFHDVIIESCQNRILQEQLRPVRLLTSPYRRHITFQPGKMLASVDEHQVIMDAILAGDSEQACQCMRQHVNLLGNDVSDLLHALSASDKDNMLFDEGTVRGN
jgi:DNA-binding GntR family transcriptional regulator